MQKKSLEFTSRNIKPRITFTREKLGLCFQIKLRTALNIITTPFINNECPESQCDDNHIGEIAGRIAERTLNHVNRDKQSYIQKQGLETRHETLDINDYRITAFLSQPLAGGCFFKTNRKDNGKKHCPTICFNPVTKLV